MRSNIKIVNEHDDNFDISSLKFLPSIQLIIANENIAINQNIAQPYSDLLDFILIFTIIIIMAVSHCLVKILNVSHGSHMKS